MNHHGKNVIIFFSPRPASGALRSSIVFLNSKPVEAANSLVIGFPKTLKNELNSGKT